jgi:hypothetical protein
MWRPVTQLDWLHGIADWIGLDLLNMVDPHSLGSMLV